MAVEDKHIIQSPPAWLWEKLTAAQQDVGSAGADEYWSRRAASGGVPAVRRIGLADLREALARGLGDFAASRTDIVFVCIMYPVAGLLLGNLASGAGFLPLLFPLASGFALLGPFAAVGLTEMSRRREQGLVIRWFDALGVLTAPAIGAIALYGLTLIGVLLAWLACAQWIYAATLGPLPPDSVADFARDVLTTTPGHVMMAFGVGVGFLFAAGVLVTGVVTIPLLLDRPVSMRTAMLTSLHAAQRNPLEIALWGLIVVALLVLGSLPALLGLVVVMPVLGHATWHLYRRLVV